MVDILWMTRGIAKSIKMKNKLYHKFMWYPNKANKMINKRYRNKLNHLLRITEKHHYQEVLEQNKKNASKTWAIIKNIVNKNKPKLMNYSFKYNNSIINDSTTIANKFNDYFVNVALNLAKKNTNYRYHPYFIFKRKLQPLFFHQPSGGTRGS